MYIESNGVNEYKLKKRLDSADLREFRASGDLGYNVEDITGFGSLFI